MEILDILYKQTGFKARNYKPFYSHNVHELFLILKDFIRDEYEVSKETLDTIKFAFIDCIDTYAKRIKQKNKSTIVLGANLDTLLDFVYTINNKKERHAELLRYNIISKLICQKQLVTSNLHGAVFMLDFYEQVWDDFQKINKNQKISNFNDTVENHIRKIKAFCYILAHEFGHLLFEMGKLNNEVNLIDKFITRLSITGSESVLKNVHMWDVISDVLENTTMKEIQKKERESSSGIDAANYLFLSKNGQKKSTEFFKSILKNHRIMEELVCDLFSIKFFIMIFGEEESLDFINELNEIQSSLTIMGCLFNSDASTFSFSLFKESYCRYVINPEIMQLLSKRKIENKSHLLKNKFFADILLLSSTYEKMKNDFEIDIPDFFEDSNAYESMVNELFEFSNLNYSDIVENN